MNTLHPCMKYAYFNAPCEQNKDTSSSDQFACYLRCQCEEAHAAPRKQTWHCWLRRPLCRDEIQPCLYAHSPLFISLHHFLLFFFCLISSFLSISDQCFSSFLFSSPFALYQWRCWKTWAAVTGSSCFLCFQAQHEPLISWPAGCCSCCSARGNIQNRSQRAILALFWILLIIVCVIMWIFQ